VEPEHCFSLRRVVLWNLRTDHRARVLCWDDELALSPETVATGMLSRWGASENTFKHIQARHPYHYHPGFGVAPSEKQDIAVSPLKFVLDIKFISNSFDIKFGKLYSYAP